MDVIVFEFDRGLYPLYFGTRSIAAENLRFFGWVETNRSTHAGSMEPSEIRYFNRYIGGEGRLYPDGDRWLFLAADGWLSEVAVELKKRGLLTSPSDDERIRRISRG